MNSITKARMSEILAMDFPPVKEFMQAIHLASPFPYKTEFSLEPFVKTYEEKVGSICIKAQSEVVPMIREMEKQLHSSIPKDWLQSGFGLFSEEENNATFQEHLQRMKSLIALIMPSLLFENKPSFIAAPFVKASAYTTPAMNELILSGKYAFKTKSDHYKPRFGDNILQAGGMILERFYGQQLGIADDMRVTLKNMDTGLETHYQMDFNLDFIEVELLKPLKKLNPRQIQKLLKSMDDLELWMRYLPPDAFAFNGFSLGTFTDITPIAVLSMLKDNLVVKPVDSPVAEAGDFVPYLAEHIRNFLGSHGLELGYVGIAYEDYFDEVNFSLTGSNSIKRLSGEIGGIGSGIYDEAMETGQPVLLENLNRNNPSEGEKLLLAKGFNSVILCPCSNAKGEINIIFEIASPVANEFNAVILEKLTPIFQLMSVGNDNYLADIRSRTNLFIQKQFTSIHPSVEWKFEEVATEYQIKSSLPDFDGGISPILFKDVVPLYGQSDIVGSSRKRNSAIQTDLSENLALVTQLMKSWYEIVPMHTLKAAIGKVELLHLRLQKNFVSSDESHVIDLLTSNIHPFLKTLSERFSELPSEPYEEYKAALDPSIGIVYHQRKHYEQSVSRLNQAISDYVETDDEKMQRILPHYFEKYKTDGVEYNIYIGQSILETGEFNKYYLREFRLWQLIQMCEITRLSDKIGAELAVPMRTAQLVFVYSSPLSIRFRMDEKQFDVDGTYNVRYEILKKRIDKAYLKGSKERLTIPGAVSVVYLQERDRVEYLEYIDFLIQQNYIEPTFEEVDLQKLEGADGLHALRLTVKAG